MHNKIEKESFETLENILKNGILFKAVIDNEFAGVFALIRKKSLFFKCYFVREEILFEKFRGKGYGAIFQRKVLDTLPTEEIDIICGGIHSENYPSLRTAFKCGRSVIESDFFIKL